MNRFLLAGVFACLGLALGAAPALARPSIADAWDALYEGPSSPCGVPSNAMQNVFQGTGTRCQFCHEETSGLEPWNGYGWDLRVGIVDQGMTVPQALLGAQGLNSDLDPGGSSNLDEICADTQPGWTPGPINRLYCRDGSPRCDGGSTLENQDPPALILGLLDPDEPVACEVEMSQAVYTDGETAIVSSLRLANPSAEATAVEFKTWIVRADGTTSSHVRIGADGSLVLPAGFDRDLGPAPLFTVTAPAARGTYGFGCRTLDPVTGETRTLDEAFFEVQ